MGLSRDEKVGLVERFKILLDMEEGPKQAPVFSEDLSIRKDKNSQPKLIDRAMGRLNKGQEWVVDNMMILWSTGSHLYGTNTEDSDLDYEGVTIEPIECLFGLNNFGEADLSSKKSSEDRKNTREDLDFKIRGLTKFISLTMNGNPATMECLFAPERCIIYCNDYGRELIKMAKYLLSLRFKHSLAGYAFSQMKKLQVKNENMTGRKELVEKYGYDTKFATHAIRLLYEGTELLTTGRIEFPLTERRKIVAIKNGFYGDVSDVVAESSRLKELFDVAATTSVLPSRPDYMAINKYLIKTYSGFHGLMEGPKVGQPNPR